MRLPPPSDVDDLVRQFWVPEWDMPAGKVHRSLVLTYPACNLVAEPHGFALHGPTTRISHRDLSGRGWAVGALLLPAASALVELDVASIIDGERDLPGEPVLDAIREQMNERRPNRHAASTRLLSDWLAARKATRWPDGMPDEVNAANTLFSLVNADDSVLRLDDLAGRLQLSPRTVQRIARRYIGFTPAAMIRRRRLQNAAQRVRTGTSLTEVAADLGYSDQAHLTRDFRDVLGLTPGQWRPA